MPAKYPQDMLFKQYTTSQDYSYPKAKKVEWKNPEKQTRVKTIIYEPVKHTETLFPFKKTLSFGLYHKIKKSASEDYPEEITKEDLKQEITPEFIANRPRVIMTPQLCLDDIKDMKIRDTLIQNTYLSATQRAAVKVPLDKNVAPLVGKYTNKPIYLAPLREPVVCPEWRMDSCKWDRRQLRSFVDPDKEFWRTHNLYKNCISCNESANWAQHKRMKRMHM